MEEIKGEGMMGDMMGGMHTGILKTLHHCEATCEHTLHMLMGSDSSRAEQLRMLHDCADICTLTAKYVERGSMFAGHLAALCAHICQMCGNHCLQHPDPESQHCGRICLQCAQECMAYSGMPMYPGPGYGGMPGVYPGMYADQEKK